MALRVANQFLWVWSIITVLDYHPHQALASLAEEESQVKLKSCCFDGINTSYAENQQNKSAECSEDTYVSWNLLKSFRIPRINGTSIINETTLVLNENLQNSLKCQDGSVTQYRIPALEEDELNVFVTPKQGFFAFFSQDGHFQFDQAIYQPIEYCVQRISTEEISVHVCTSHDASQCSEKLKENYTNAASNTHTRPCLVRCCNHGEVWDVWSNYPILRCVDSGEYKWEPKLYSDLFSNESEETSSSENEREYHGTPFMIAAHPRFLSKNTCVTKSRTFQSSNEGLHGTKEISNIIGQRPFRVLKDGSVWMKLRKREWTQLKPGEYCIDGFQYGPRNYSGDNLDSILFECKVLETKEQKAGKERQRTFSLVFGLLLLFCLCFLLMTTLVYILLWSKHNVHGYTVFCYIFALVATYFFLGISHFSSITLVKEKGRQGIWTFCGVIGIMCHFTFLSAFSWSTVLNWDLWCTFRNLRPSSRNSKGVKKFLVYCLFAFTVPTTIVTTGAILDITYRDDVNSDVITPEYGLSVCAVEPRHARFYFVILPIAILLAVNLIFFCNTAIAVYKVKKSTQFASSNSTKNQSSNQTFRLIMKLLLINGSIWVVEIISWYLQTDYEEVGLLSFTLDVVNVLQAVAIFFLFVFKNDILDALKRTYPKLTGVVNAAYKLKNLGKSRTSRESTAPSTDGTSTNTRTVENMPVTKV